MFISMKTFSITVALATISASGNIGRASASDGVDSWSALPWSDLESKLSSSAILLQNDNPAVAYKEQCAPVYKKQLYPFDPTLPVRTHHDLVDQPSGLCMNQMYCAYEGCNPIGGDDGSLTIEEKWDIITKESNENFDQITNQTLLDYWLRENNSAWNLPTTVLFPVIASDIVAAINFAKDHGLEVSVKNSGHSYTGASTKKNTLHINLNRYTAYSPTGIMECDDADTTIENTGGAVESRSDTFQSDLSDQPCALAKARGKPAVIRIGSGENFSESYLSVKAFNEAAKASGGSYKYHLVGGGAGTVSPMGWTWQGGLASTTNGRMYGFGVDQVLRVDMVLPSGEHVRFGPTEWQVMDEYIVPKTTAVTGVCQENPQEQDESKWIWSTCKDDTINFDDLWFAIRGGGGGTWGVVTSVIIQLHDYGRVEMVEPNGLLGGCMPPEVLPILGPFWVQFITDFFFNPSSLGVTQEESDHCGAFAPSMFCFGEGTSQPVTAAWASYVTNNNQTLVTAGIDSSLLDEIATFCSNDIPIFDDYASVVMIQDGPHKGKANDLPPPTYPSTTEEGINMLLPTKFYMENRDKFFEFEFSYFAFGGQVKYTSDQANALSPAHRDAAVMAMQSLTVLDDEFYTKWFPLMYDTTDPNNFPGFVGSNHAGPNTRGPLKTDWTKACPLDWTQEERDDKCISLQEAIWGTQLLKRLEQIKKDIDPNYMFDCYGCIGNNRPKKDTTTSSGINPGTTTYSSSEYDGDTSSSTAPLASWKMTAGSAVPAAAILVSFGL